MFYMKQFCKQLKSFKIADFLGATDRQLSREIGPFYAI